MALRLTKPTPFDEKVTKIQHEQSLTQSLLGAREHSSWRVHSLLGAREFHAEDMETQWIGIWTNIRLTDVAPSAAGWAPVEHLWAKRRGSLGTTMLATPSDTLNPWKSRFSSIFHRFFYGFSINFCFHSTFLHPNLHSPFPIQPLRGAGGG